MARGQILNPALSLLININSRSKYEQEEREFAKYISPQQLSAFQAINDADHSDQRKQIGKKLYHISCFDRSFNILFARYPVQQVITKQAENPMGLNAYNLPVLRAKLRPLAGVFLSSGFPLSADSFSILLGQGTTPAKHIDADNYQHQTQNKLIKQDSRYTKRY